MSVDLNQMDESFVSRHIGVSEKDISAMLGVLGYPSLDALIDATVPAGIRLKKPLDLGKPRTESETLSELRSIAKKNKVMRSLIGMGYHDTITPSIILRHIVENPCWYTQYTPYQAEISQGRLEALFYFQTMICDLTAMPLANASLLDEATAAAEAMFMCRSIVPAENPIFLVSNNCHPRTLAVVKTRAKSLGIQVQILEESPINENVCGILIQYPGTDGQITNPAPWIEKAHGAGAKVVMACDLLALTLIKPPGEWDADIAIGSAQRFGVPMGYGGPSAGFMACKMEYLRKMPGRIIGLSKDSNGAPAFRLAIQTREQHIRREKATSNICTAQVLLAIVAAMYAIYHGPDGLRQQAARLHQYAAMLAKGLSLLGHHVVSNSFFDTLRVKLSSKMKSKDVLDLAKAKGINLRDYDNGDIGVAFDEHSTPNELVNLLECFNCGNHAPLTLGDVATQGNNIENRKTNFLTDKVFHEHHCEAKMTRYITLLASRDLSLAHSMIPLGSCTMKLNPASAMTPITWTRFAQMHPFAPADQAKGYQILFKQLETWLAEITGMAATWLEPNAGSQGEYAGLLTIRAYHESRGQSVRNVCLIPASAHGTNPASAMIAGLTVVVVSCDEKGNIDIEDLKKKAAEHKDKLAALMVTYPSTHGVFEEAIVEICKIVHDAGGLVYMDGANMNAQVGLCRPGDIGADVCHLNLHKTFAIPHGGGGPGMAPICVNKTLAKFIPSNKNEGVGAVSQSPFGSASILPIAWAYIAMMGSEGLTKATKVAILSANYIARKLEKHYPVLYLGKNGSCAHECIFDCRHFETTAGVKVEDIAKRLMDYGFHAPTMSFPVPGTLMVEPTESEPLDELDRFIDAMIRIRAEIADIESGKMDKADNVLKNAPHTAKMIASDSWRHSYPRELAAYGAPWIVDRKFWPAVGRVDNPYGDRNLVCACGGMHE